MILIIGGYASGKRTYAGALGYEADALADGVLDERPGIFNVQDLVAERVNDLAAGGGLDRDGKDLDIAVELAAELAQKEIVLCTEVGSGIVPMSRAARAAREQTGRLCAILADRADSVVRMTCGIPVALKGELPR